MNHLHTLMPNIALETETSINSVFRVRNLQELEFSVQDLHDAVKAHGYCIIKAWDNSHDTFVKISSLFGQIQNHEFAYADGVVDVKHEKDTAENPRFGSKKDDFMPHTDGSPLGGVVVKNGRHMRVEAPAYVTLQCVKQSATGGESMIVDTQEILREIFRSDRALFDAITTHGMVSHSHGELRSQERALFDKTADGKYRIKFKDDKTYIKAEVFDHVRFVMQNYFFDPGRFIKFTLQPGDILVVDNFRVLHGRTGVESKQSVAVVSDETLLRHMRRAWIWDSSASDTVSMNLAGLDANDAPQSLYGRYLPLDHINAHKSAQDLSPGIDPRKIG